MTAYSQYYADFHSKYPLSPKQKQYAEAGISWMIRNGAEPLSRGEMKRGIKREIKKKYGIDPISAFFLSLILSKIASWVIDWFTDKFM